jgi:hypothetical protein
MSRKPRRRGCQEICSYWLSGQLAEPGKCGRQRRWNVGERNFGYLGVNRQPRLSSDLCWARFTSFLCTSQSERHLAKSDFLPFMPLEKWEQRQHIPRTLDYNGQRFSPQGLTSWLPPIVHQRSTSVPCPACSPIEVLNQPPPLRHTTER